MRVIEINAKRKEVQYTQALYLSGKPKTAVDAIDRQIMDNGRINMQLYIFIKVIIMLRLMLIMGQDDKDITMRRRRMMMIIDDDEDDYNDDDRL